jgi:hypothetical protein
MVPRFAVPLLLIMPAMLCEGRAQTANGLEQQKTTGFCSPAIDNITGNVTTNCYVTVSALHDAVNSHLQLVISAVRELLTTQRYYMFPSLDDYIHNRNSENWSAVKFDVDLVHKRLVYAIDAVVSYDADLEPQLGPDLADLHAALRSRGGLLSELPTEPPDKTFLTNWVERYRVQVSRLYGELSTLEGQFENAKFKQDAR